MRNLLLAGAALAAALIATPALAQTNAGFVGPRAELQVGVTDDNLRDTRASYGIALGADTAIGDRTIVGIDANATNVFDRDNRILGAGVRLGYAFNPKVLGYLRAGYANLDYGHGHLNGATAGGGAEFRVGKQTYLNTEYRYTNYERGVDSHAGLLGIGIRF